MRMSNAQVTMGIALAIVCVAFHLLTGGTFLTARNISNLCIQTSYIGVLAAGVVMVIVAGNIDLSIGSLVGFVGSVMARLMVTYNWPTIPVILLGLCIGLVVGAFQGYMIACRAVPAYVVTLSGWLTWRGLCMAVTGGTSLGPMKPLFKQFGQGYAPSPVTLTVVVGVLAVLAIIATRMRNRKIKRRYGFTVLSKGREGLACTGLCALVAAFTYVFASHMGIPYPVVILAVVIFSLYFLTTKTVFGRHVFAYGSNREAANLSGINTNRVNMLIYVIMGLLCSVSAVILTGRLNSCMASTGNMLEMDVIAAAIIGGTSTLGGEGTVVGAIIGAFFMAALDNGMSLLNMASAYQYVVKGFVLLLAVWMDIENRKRNQ